MPRAPFLVTELKKPRTRFESSLLQSIVFNQQRFNRRWLQSCRRSRACVCMLLAFLRLKSCFCYCWKSGVARLGRYKSAPITRQQPIECELWLAALRHLLNYTARAAFVFSVLHPTVAREKQAPRSEARCRSIRQAVRAPVSHQSNGKDLTHT